MDYKRTVKNIYKAIENDPDNERGYEDAQSLFVLWVEEDSKEVIKNIGKFRDLVSRETERCLKRGDIEDAEDYRKLLYNSYLITAKYVFEDYLIALEFDRPAPEKFYLPRRNRLKKVVDALQELEDNKLDELFLSMPPRVGKTSILMFYETWLIGKDSEEHNLYCSYSDIITKAFFSGVLEILNDPVTYKWGEIFPNVPLQSTNADEETINTGRYKRYKSLTCRSLYGTLNGACDANGTLIADDLIGSIEEAMNKDRLLNAWSKVDNNMIPRAKEKCKLLWCGTRWSMIDPIGLREDLLKNDEGFKSRRYKIIDLPALNDKDESNFDYSYGVGFSTEYYRQRRSSFERNNDIQSWQAQYMTQPIERAGAVFEAGDMRMYNGDLPETAPDRTFMVVDPAWGGGDFVSAPVCKQYGEDIYVCDVVYTNDDKSVSQPTIAQIAAYNGVDKIQIEANKMTDDFRIGIDDALKRIEYHCPVIAKPAPNNIAKEQRIFDKAPDIKEHFIFLEDGKRNKPYTLFMQNVFSFKILGNNKHDDAPDSLSMAAEEAFPKKVYTKISIFNRRF